MLNPAGSSSVKTQWQMKQQYYNEGQSDEQVESFYASWRETFITRADIDYIASLGFNSLRLPLHYELFLTSSQRSIEKRVWLVSSTTAVPLRTLLHGASSV
jgi:endoglucanase